MQTTYTETEQEIAQPDTNAEQPEEQEVKGAEKLKAFRNMPNMADSENGAGFDDNTLQEIGTLVLTGYSSDETSRSEWLERYEKSIRAAMQETEEKNFPFPQASNVKWPMIATACQQFHARAYGAIVKGKDIVKGKVLVDDPNNDLQKVADRVGEHMSNQLIEEMQGWIDGLDNTLAQLPNIGCVFKKTYFSKVKRLNVSEYLTAKEVVIKYDAKSMEEAPRITHPQTYTQNEIMSFINSGQWREDAQDIFSTKEDDTNDEFDYLEQHCLYDFDEDGYKEPYIVTVEKETGKVVRIVARYDMAGIETNDKDIIIRIKPIEYFTRYTFLPSPDGGIYAMGFGTLLGPIADAVDTILNQLIDAGTLDNVGGGFISTRVKLGKRRSDTMSFKPNEWKQVEISGNIRDGLLPLPTKGPSATLFQLLGLIMNAGKELSSVTELMTGESRGANESPTTIMALIEQGTMVFTAIYKRIYRALKEEFKKIYRLNTMYLTAEYVSGPQTATQEDYLNSRIYIIPIADPSDAVNMQRIAKAQALMQLKGQGLNDEEITKRYLQALDIEDIDKLFPQGPPPPNPLVLVEQEKLKMEQVKLNLDTDAKKLERQKFEWQMIKDKADLQETLSKVVLNLASAEAKEAGTQLEQYKQQAESLQAQVEAMSGNIETGMAGIQGQPYNAQGSPGNQAGPATGAESVL